MALEALRGDRTVQAIAAKHEVHPNQVGVWKRQAIDGLEEVFAGGRASRDSEHEATVQRGFALTITCEGTGGTGGLRARLSPAWGDPGVETR